MKVLIAPDSFKGSLSAPAAAAAIARGWRRVFPDSDCILLPIADGGEGTADALASATGGRLITRTVTGPLGDPVHARYALLGDGRTAVVEMAEAAGLSLVPPDKRDPKITTTYGVGELLMAALNEPGINRIVITLGGSATNDGGAGLLEALGVRFLDSAGNAISRGGAGLAELGEALTPVGEEEAPIPSPSPLFGGRVPEANSSAASRPLVAESVIGPPPLARGRGWGWGPLSSPDVRASSIFLACDVDNPLTGTRGASAVFGPQKGAKPEDVALLDAALTHYANVLAEASGRNVADIPGAGAAGGTAAGLLWFFPDAKLVPGVELVLDALRFGEHLNGANLVITGEGRLDSQTLGGKAIAGVARRAKAKGVPVSAIVGGLTGDVTGDLLAEKLGLDAVTPLPPYPCQMEEAVAHASEWLADAAERSARWLRLGTRP